MIYCLVGVGFVNYLYAPIGLVDDFEEAARSAGIHKAHVEEALDRHRSDPVIWAKFRWVGVYYNFFCGTWLPKEPDLLIPNQALGVPLPFWSRGHCAQLELQATHRVEVMTLRRSRDRLRDGRGGRSTFVIKPETHPRALEPTPPPR